MDALLLVLMEELSDFGLHAFHIASRVVDLDPEFASVIGLLDLFETFVHGFKLFIQQCDDLLVVAHVLFDDLAWQACFSG